MRVLVTGGTGVLGRHAVTRLLSRGHEVRVFSRRDSPSLPSGVAAFRGDLAKGTGIAPAVEGVDAVLHAASNTGIGLGRGDAKGTTALCAAAKEAGVRHLLYVSIVGIDRIPFGYYQRKLACERLVVESGIPHTILRATQFHELLAAALRRLDPLPVALLPVSFRFQPVASEEVAARVLELLEHPPSGRAPDFGGPEVLTLGTMARSWREVRGRGPRWIVPLPLPGRAAAAFREGRNTCPGLASGVTTWASYSRQARG